MSFKLVNIVDGSLGQLTTSVATYGQSVGVPSKINNATIQNTSGNVTLVNVWLVPPSASVADQYKLINNRPVLVGETYNCPELVNKNLMANGTLQAVASGNASLSLLVSGIQVNAP